MLHWSHFYELFILLHLALAALTNRNYCTVCLSISGKRLCSLYRPELSLEKKCAVNLSYFRFDQGRHKLFERLLRTIFDARYFLEEALFLIQQEESKFPTTTFSSLNDLFVKVILELRFGVFYKSIPHPHTWHALTEYGLNVKIRSVKRCFYMPIKKLIHQLYLHYQDIYYPNIFYELVYDYIGLHTYPCKLHQKQLKTPLAFGPKIPTRNVYRTCKICLASNSLLCTH